MSPRRKEPSAASVFVKNLKALQFNTERYNNNNNNRHKRFILDERTFTARDGTVRSFEIISYFLFQLLDSTKANSTFKGVYPVTTKRQSLEYRCLAFNWLREIQSGSPLMNTPLRKSHLTDCRGEPINKILAALTTIVVNKQPPNLKKETNTPPPPPHKPQQPTKPEVSSAKKTNTAKPGKRSLDQRPGSTEDPTAKKTKVAVVTDVKEATSTSNKHPSLKSTTKLLFTRDDSNYRSYEERLALKYEAYDSARAWVMSIAKYTDYFVASAAHCHHPAAPSTTHTAKSKERPPVYTRRPLKVLDFPDRPIPAPSPFIPSHVPPIPESLLASSPSSTSEHVSNKTTELEYYRFDAFIRDMKAKSKK
ncbi:HAUS augmin-like complex subunit 6 N-terminus-domain-containing protein [Mucor mucedo]|uniref:HAUS augmin-like complex subunit 6 N-terminus-domain-containing protein n=1 Tax=Mucor mucedo TaxID=29922 RepID=UPI00221EED68|nr:HAUS augmin-like complex subunit 6 N-terminus-domain-containing protein [Mucor mucedo]KAI7893076.1 HAUS augmin-like complex subunit 6 N-terminus-domain-containing protein [Mucor mucedo]